MTTRFPAAGLILASCLALAACARLTGTGGQTLDVPAEAPPVAPPVDSTTDEPATLLGLGHDGLVRRLGEPAFVWTEGDARMLRYDTGSCRLLVFLYPDGVRHVEILPETHEDPAACVAEAELNSS